MRFSSIFFTITLMIEKNYQMKLQTPCIRGKREMSSDMFIFVLICYEDAIKMHLVS